MNVTEIVDELRATRPRAGEALRLQVLTLAATPSGALMISAVSAANDAGVVQGLRAGDRLLQVNGVEMTGATLSAAQKALAGRPGEMKTIVVERAGAQVTAQAKVSRIL